jgi:hypothetical protein
MNNKEYKILSNAVADLNIALCAMDDKQNKEMKDPKKIAMYKVLNAYLLIDRMLIKKSNYDNQ